MTGGANNRWPVDLRIFGAIFAIWGVSLLVRVFTQSGLGEAADPAQAVIFGYKLYGVGARLVLLVLSAVYAFFGIGMLTQRRWALVVALFYFSQVVISLLVFIALYWRVPGQEIHVQYSAFGGPLIVMFLLYLWIRSRELIFGSDPAV
jgi:hypothetical protein